MALTRRSHLIVMACFLFCRFLNHIYTADLYVGLHSVPLFQIGKQDPLKTIDLSKESASLCVICKDENAYIDEWTDYNLALGFSEIFFYDNSDNNTLVSWKEKSRHEDERISIIHFPGPGKQFDSYLA